MLFAEDASAQLISLRAALPAITNSFTNNTAGGCIGVCVGICVVGRFVHVLDCAVFVRQVH